MIKADIGHYLTCVSKPSIALQSQAVVVKNGEAVKYSHRSTQEEDRAYFYILILLLAFCFLLASSKSLFLYLTCTLKLLGWLSVLRTKPLPLQLPHCDLLPQISVRHQKPLSLILRQEWAKLIKMYHPQQQELLPGLCNTLYTGVGKPGLSLLKFKNKKYSLYNKKG